VYIRYVHCRSSTTRPWCHNKTCLDYCNAVLAASTLASLQRVLHAATRIVFNLKPQENLLTPVLQELPWRGENLVQVMFAGAQDSALGHMPDYMADLLTLADSPAMEPYNKCYYIGGPCPSKVVTTSVASWRSQRATDIVNLSTTEPSRLLRRKFGTGCKATTIDSGIQTPVLSAWLMKLRTPLFNFVMRHRSNSRGTLDMPYSHSYSLHLDRYV